MRQHEVMRVGRHLELEQMVQTDGWPAPMGDDRKEPARCNRRKRALRSGVCSWMGKYLRLMYVSGFDVRRLGHVYFGVSSKSCWVKINGACYSRRVCGSGLLTERFIWLNMLYVADFGVEGTNLFFRRNMLIDRKQGGKGC